MRRSYHSRQAGTPLRRWGQTLRDVGRCGAASGGYYMAMTGDPVVAYPLTQTGSIGVVFGKPNLHGLYDKLGIDKDALQRGRELVTLSGCGTACSALNR